MSNALRITVLLIINPNYKGHEAYFLRQVDDFAISALSIDICNAIIAEIDNHMTIKVKPLGIIERFNGVNILQTRHYVKVSNQTYLTKILSDKKIQQDASHNLPIPMSKDSKYNRSIEEAIPLTPEDLKK